MTQLVIIGDSWSCGEWQHTTDGQLELSHPGINQYLADRFDVLNLSRCGASNWQICYTLHNFLEYNLPMISDQCEILLVQSDPARSDQCQHFDVDFDSEIQKAGSLRDLYTTLAEVFYIKCNDLARQYNKRIMISGGLTDLDLDILSLYNDLTPICQSWIQLIEPDHHPSVMPLRMNPNTFIVAKRLGRLDICDEIVDHSNSNLLKLQNMLEIKSKYFGPSRGDFHPSRHGHELFSNHIKSVLGDTNA